MRAASIVAARVLSSPPFSYLPDRLDQPKRFSILTRLIYALHWEGSECKYDHLQQAVFFLQWALNIRLGYDFQLFAEGPQSRDLNLEIAEMIEEKHLVVCKERIFWAEEITPLRSYKSPIQFTAHVCGDRSLETLQYLMTTILILAGAAKNDQNFYQDRRNLSILLQHKKPLFSLAETEENLRRVEASLIQLQARCGERLEAFGGDPDHLEENEISR